MKKLLIAILMTLFFSLSTTNSIAAVINGGFESGLTGWTGGSNFYYYTDEMIENYAWVQPSNQWQQAKEGTYYLELNNGVIFPTTWVYQDIYMRAGETLSGYGALSAIYNEQHGEASVSIGTNPIWYASGASETSIPWSKWQWTAQQSGQYRLQLTWSDWDGCGSPVGKFDGISVSSATPIPNTIWLIVPSLVGLFGLRKKYHK
jgi:hypothetical protein